MFIEKYSNKRKLGKGAFGHVYLVEDKQGKEYAMKLISRDKIRQHSYLQEYLEGEIECMKKMNSPYIIKLYQTLEDNDYTYLVLEYCDAGDLTIEQASLPGMVYPLEKATEVLSQVIRGLEYLHSQGYLHRDLKLQNILKSSFEGIVKLADFGFSKPQQLTSGTNLGTEQFKAPQIFAEQPYAFGVDMWAFGVLFYYMLNKQYPFKIGIYKTEEKKGKELAQAAKNFSYQKAVKRSNKQLTQNCSKQMEDLFRRIFELDPEKRINFIQIRQHPIFLKHFPLIEEKSRIVYNSRFNDSKSRVIKSNFLQIPKSTENAQFQHSRIHIRNPYLVEEKQILGRRKDQIDSLKETAQIFLECQYLQPHESLMLCYNLIKYYLVLLRRFSAQLRVDVLNKLYPNKQWAGYCQTKQFKQLLKEVSHDLTSYELKFIGLYDECSLELESINNSNPHFQEGFSLTINEVQFDGPFKKSYRQSTRLAYKVLVKLIGKQKGNIIAYLLTMNAICHAFNQILDNPQNAAKIFEIHLQQKKISPDKLNYSELREWLSKSSEQTLKRVVQQILTFYQV